MIMHIITCTMPTMMHITITLRTPVPAEQACQTAHSWSLPMRGQAVAFTETVVELTQARDQEASTITAHGAKT